MKKRLVALLVLLAVLAFAVWRYFLWRAVTHEIEQTVTISPLPEQEPRTQPAIIVETSEESIVAPAKPITAKKEKKTAKAPKELVELQEIPEIPTKRTKAEQPKTIATAIDVQKTTQQSATRTVTVVNDITDKQKKYKYLMIHYSPTTFNVTANDTQIAQDDKTTINLDGNVLDITYYAQFQNGRESSKKYRFNIVPHATTVTFNYDWHADPRIVIDPAIATYVSTTDII